MDFEKALQKEDLFCCYNCDKAHLSFCPAHILYRSDVLWLAQIVVDAWAEDGVVWIMGSGHSGYSAVGANKLIW